MNDWGRLGERVLSGKEITREEALEIVQAPDSETLLIAQAAAKIRRAYWENRIRLHLLLNAKSGLCSEDCSYCSQSRISNAPVPRYSLLAEEKILRAAEQASALQAYTFCIVASGRRPSDSDLEKTGKAVRAIKERHPLRICASLGFLKEEEAGFLKSCGVDKYNHNLNTSPRFHEEICTTHSFWDRVRTVEAVRKAGMGSCCGGIAGMGEKPEDVVDLAFHLRRLQPDSVPLNFLHPRHGTPLAGVWTLTPLRALRILSLFRFLHPSADLRVAGGRELHLGPYQPYALQVASSIFVGDYLTTKGRPPEADYRMIQEAGLHIETAGQTLRP